MIYIIIETESFYKTNYTTRVSIYTCPTEYMSHYLACARLSKIASNRVFDYNYQYKMLRKGPITDEVCELLTSSFDGGIDATLKVIENSF